MAEEWHRHVKVLSQIGISIIVLAAAFYILLSGSYPEDYNKWAFGIIGVIVGYWLK